MPGESVHRGLVGVRTKAVERGMSGAGGPRDDRSTLRVATAPVNWNNNDLADWRQHVPFPDLLSQMCSAGYTATEWGSNFPASVGELRDVLASRDMSLCGAYQWLPLCDCAVLAEALSALDAKLALLQACGCHDLIIADALTPQRIALAGHVPADGSASLDAAGFHAIAEGAARTAAAAHRFQVAVHYHNHVGTYVETPAEVDRLLPLLEERGLDLCFDTGHYAYGGGDPVAFVAANAARIGYLHLKDVDGAVLDEAKLRRWSFLEALRHIVFAPLGTGIVDIRGLIESLRKHDNAGWIVIEQDTCAGDPTTTARRNLEYLRSIAGHVYPAIDERMKGNR